MKVYIVTTGNYEDYIIEAVFSTEEKAKEYVKEKEASLLPYKDNSLDIEEYEIDNKEIEK